MFGCVFYAFGIPALYIYLLLVRPSLLEESDSVTWVCQIYSRGKDLATDPILKKKFGFL